jgi:hypothetical protein
MRLNENRLIWEAYSKAQDIANIDKLPIIEKDPGDGTYEPDVLLEPPHIDISNDELPVDVDRLSRRDAYKTLPFREQNLSLRDIIISQDVVYRNTLLKLAGVDLQQATPILVFLYDDVYYLIDGNHRFAIQYMRDPSSSLPARVCILPK